MPGADRLGDRFSGRSSALFKYRFFQDPFYVYSVALRHAPNTRNRFRYRHADRLREHDRSGLSGSADDDRGRFEKCLMTIPLKYNLRNLFVRKTTTLFTAGSIALTVA